MLEAVAAHGLLDDSPSDITPLSDREFSDFVSGCERHRLVGLAGAAARSGALPFERSQHQRLEDRLREWLAHGLRAERLTLAAADVLAAAGIEHRILKGIALAHTVYPDPAWRVFGDADLLVPADALTTAAHVLGSALGLERPVGELRQGFDDRFGKEAMLRSREGLELDVHRTFVAGALGLTVHLPDLFDPGHTFTLGEHRLEMLPPPHLLLHAAYNAVLGDWPPRLIALRDVAQVLLTCPPADAEVLALAHRWQAEAVLARGLVEAWEVLSPPVSPSLVEWARTYRPRRVERLVLASHLGRARAYTRHLAALVVLHGGSTRFAYLRAIAWPQPAYLASRGTTRGRFASRVLARFRRPGP